MIDDWEGIRGKRKGEGMRARTKFLFQAILLGIGTAIVLKYLLGSPDLIVPVHSHGTFDLDWWYVPIAAFIIVGSSNAVNFTDGLDGLAGLISATAFAAYAMIASISIKFISLASVSHWSARCSAFYGSTSIPLNSSWAIPVRFLSARHWQLSL